MPNCARRAAGKQLLKCPNGPLWHLCYCPLLNLAEVRELAAAYPEVMLRTVQQKDKSRTVQQKDQG